MAPTEARRGDVWLVALGAARAGELGKHRPAVVMTADALLTGESDDLVTVVGLSSARAPSVLRPRIGLDAGVERECVAVCRAVRSIAPSRLLNRLGSVPEPTMTDIEAAVRIILDLGEACPSTS